MTIPDILRRSWHNLGRAKVRVGLTAGALAIGGATMTLALAITQGAQESIAKGFGDFANVYVSVEGYAAENKSATGVQTTEEATQAQETASSKSLTPTDVAKFKALPGVQQVIPLSYYSFQSIEIGSKSYKAPFIQPLTPLENLRTLAAGKREALHGNTVIIPERYAQQAGVTNPADFIGKKLTFVHEGTPAFYSRPAVPDTRVELTVVGVTKSAATREAVQGEYAYLSPETMGSLAAAANGADDKTPATYNQILVLTDEKQTEPVKSTLKSQGYTAKTRQDSLGDALQAVGAIRTFLLVFAGIAIFTAIFGVINTQLMSVLERTREIGIMKALGLSRGGILLMFSIEAGWIGLIGSIAGTLIAIPFAILLSSVNKEAFTVPLTIPNFLLVVVVLVLIAMLSGLLPARRAAKLDPVEALRTE